MQEQKKHELWPARLQAQVESGQTIRAWCAFNGVTEATFHYWRKRLASTVAPVSQFIALPTTTRSADLLEVETPNGYVSRPVWLYTRFTNKSGFFSCHILRT